MPFVDARGQRIPRRILHYKDAAGAGPAVACSNGLLMGASMWDAQVQELRFRELSVQGAG
jgi:hypothetical protein